MEHVVMIRCLHNTTRFVLHAYISQSSTIQSKLTKQEWQKNSFETKVYSLSINFKLCQ